MSTVLCQDWCFTALIISNFTLYKNTIYKGKYRQLYVIIYYYTTISVLIIQLFNTGRKFKPRINLTIRI